ncbi:MAG: DNA polymerase III subunit delta [Alphaproteobacteria bacterium]
MKISPRDAESFLKSPDPAVCAILVYGPDTGLVSERVGALVKGAAGDLSDPFRVADFSARELIDDPARLADEAAALSLTGGRRAVRLRQADDSLAPLFREFLATAAGDSGAGDTLIVVEAGDLPARSALRKAFESAKVGAALASYRDDARSLGAVIRETLREFGHEVTADALAYLSAHLGGDRQLSRRELEKLTLYKGAEPGPIELVDAQACVGDSAALSLDDLAYAVAGGAAGEAERALARSLQEGVHAVGALRAVSRHFQRLHLVAGLIDGGLPLDDAVKRLRPPLFWKVAPVFRAQAAAWTLRTLARALGRLLEAESDCKRSGAPENTICSRALLEIAVNAPSRRRRRAS